MASIPPSFPPQDAAFWRPATAPQQQSMSNAQEAPAGADAAASGTLLVRHLPEAIPQEMLSRLFSHYGASSVRPCAGGNVMGIDREETYSVGSNFCNRMRNCAFVGFKDGILAAQAQSQLNGLRFLGKVLKVERAGKLKNTNQQSEEQSVKGSSGPPVPLLDSSTNLKKPVPVGEPISARIGVDYPFPPHLEYEYPPPDGNILTNIVNALIAVPRFYTQVLHLMNKMNIPAPFRMALPTPPLPPPVPAPPPPPPPPARPHLADLSSDESELESSGEDADNAFSRKRAKIEVIVGPAVDKGVAHEAVGLKPATLVPKEVPVIKKKNPVLQIKIVPKSMQKETTDNESNMKEPDSVKENMEQKEYATPQEIESGKLPPEEILSLPMFKNYAPGNPANVLYIKNLSKDVVVDDFFFIFGSVFETVEAARIGLNIKLMQEGRMRGQAFVTFPSIDLAQRALNLVNGYVFKGKPMIIQFGRNPSAGKAT